MPSYSYANGHNIALVGLTAFSPQPSSEGVKAVQRTFAPDGTVYEQGLYIELRWSVLRLTQYDSLLTGLALNLNISYPQTIYVPNHLFTFTRYNAIAVRPEKGTDVRRPGHFLSNIVIVFKNLVAL